MTRSTDLLRSSATVVWAGLIGLTLLSWWLGGDHGVDSAETASVLVLVVAFVKVRFVGTHFMELREAPAVLRLGFEVWCAVVCAALVVMYLLST